MSAENSNNRWWEFYFVRYFVGTVVGFGAVYLLATTEGSGLKDQIPGMNNLLNAGSMSFTLLAALGLAYCYISSAPILVLHACRSSFLYKKEKPSEEKKACNIIFNVALMFIVYLFSQKFFEGDPYLVAISTSVSLITIYQFILIYVFHKRGYNFLFYRRLCKKRAEKSKVISEYTESYRHLREHGNAFLIVLFEIVLAIALYSVKSPQIAVIIVTFWVLPSAYVWFIGSKLESKLHKIQSNKLINRTENTSVQK